MSRASEQTEQVEQRESGVAQVVLDGVCSKPCPNVGVCDDFGCIRAGASMTIITGDSAPFVPEHTARAREQSAFIAGIRDGRSRLAPYWRESALRARANRFYPSGPSQGKAASSRDAGYVFCEAHQQFHVFNVARTVQFCPRCLDGFAPRRAPALGVLDIVVRTIASAPAASVLTRESVLELIRAADQQMMAKLQPASFPDKA